MSGTGTKEVTDKGNERFRNPPRYGFQTLATGTSDDLLKFSHVAEMRLVKESLSQKEEYRIFRQGYEFLDRINASPGVRTGLNFISFQDDPKRFFDRITNLHIQKKSNTSTHWNEQKGDDPPSRLKFGPFFQSWSSWTYFVPAVDSKERFPGASIFYPFSRMKRESNIWKR